MKNYIPILTRINTLSAELKKKLPAIHFERIINDSDYEKLYKSEIIIADYDLLGPHLSKLQSTKWIQGTWAGVEKLVPYKNDIKKDIILSRFSGNHFGRLMSEYVVANIVNYERGLFNVFENKKNKNWDRKDKISKHRTIDDLTIGILGIGNIGNCIAKSLNFFGAKVWGFGRRENIPETEDYKHYDNYCRIEKLPLLLNNCDYIINVLPNTKETTGLLDGEILKNCEGKNVVFINIGRGNIISDKDLICALKNKWLSAAILDVFNTEPLPIENELWDMEQVFITPHVAGVSRAKDIAEQFATNLEYYLADKQIPAQFNIEKDY